MSEVPLYRKTRGGHQRPPTRHSSLSPEIGTHRGATALRRDLFLGKWRPGVADHSYLRLIDFGITQL